ncbi:MAG: HTH domain-containing protein [Candidatus Aenigmatarchaeota archaeon]
MTGYHNEENINPMETLILYLLNTKYKMATVKQLAKELDVSEAHIRKMLSDLKRKNLVDFLKPVFLRVMPGVCEQYQIGENLDPREKIYLSKINLDQLRQISPQLKKIEQLKGSYQKEETGS